MRGILTCLMLLASSGCAFTMSALKAVNSKGTACVDSPAFGVIDLVIAGAATAGIANTDAAPGYYAVPGVFALSGLIGLVSASNCSGEGRTAVAGTPPASNAAPPFGEAPVDPTLRDATLEDRGRIPDPEVAPRLPLPTVASDPEVPKPAEAAPEVPKPVEAPADPPEPTCTLTPRKDCPDHYYCSLVKENEGVFVRIR